MLRQLANCASKCYISNMNRAALLSDFERKYFWWEPIGTESRSPDRIVAQAMDLASFDDIRRLEHEFGYSTLLNTMLAAQPGWLSDRSWEFWRGRLAFATGRAIPEDAPRRSFDAADL
jgi:hypothetical protein